MTALFTRVLLLSLALTACNDTANICQAALDQANQIETTLANQRAQIDDLKRLAQEVADSKSDRREESKKRCLESVNKPTCQEADLTMALQRATTCERDIEDLKAQVTGAVQSWKDPNQPYDTAIEQLDRLGDLGR